MSILAELQRDIQDTSAAIARMEEELARKPSAYLLANMDSLQKRQDDLEAKFRVEASKQELDVCSYRLFSDIGRPLASDIGKILANFQSLFSVVLGAVRHGPRQTTKVPADVADESGLGFGYTYSGSIGIVMTLPNEKALLDTHVDEAMKIVFEMMKADNSSEVSHYAKKYGIATVRAMHSWAEAHARSDFGADIQWKREEQIRANVFIQIPEIERLKSAISAMSDESITKLKLTGLLVGADSEKKTFHFKVGDNDYFGKFADAISATDTVELPKYYKAKITMRKKVYYSTEKEDIDYFLDTLEEA